MIEPTSTDVLVTPIWRDRADDDEQWHLDMTLRTNSEVDHVFLAPRSLDVGWYRHRHPRSRVVRGPDTAFRDVESYSRTMLDPRLYRAFRQYRFLVVVQLDAVLVRDLGPVLEGAGWDYAGAPFVEKHMISALTILSRTAGDVEQRFHPRVLVRVGNGGLSVRRVAVFEQALARRRLLGALSRVNEDLVIGWLGARGVIRAAAPEEAGELFVERAASVPSGAEPYGYHALRRWQPDEFERLRRQGPDGPEVASDQGFIPGR